MSGLDESESDRWPLERNSQDSKLSRLSCTLQIYQAIADGLRHRCRTLEEERDEIQRYRVRLRNERNALRDQVTDLQRTNRIQDLALLRLSHRAEILRRTLQTVHSQWAGDRPASDPLKTESQVVDRMRQIGRTIDQDPAESQREQQEVHTLCARVALEPDRPA